ncbi:CobW family GTP-binding protein [Psychrobacter urativorans]|uniref:Cobalamin biosynthesis protein P47K n=1 Tax=Psychrobacter urativorans TaxID=45610 RepID=A0A0M5MJW6_9GAMM|nr:CobW family GTP-binding protein [Psychrobacter urativorans]ALF59830.1 cobalamin biosynthesis protein P47K [Psychrobacter urativorans]
MTISPIIQNIPCTLVTGFLGAGKTSVINQLLTTKLVDARWALLINEFGRIGIDGALLANANHEPNHHEPSNIAISEVSGGCICCTSQLPLQIALSRLLSEHRPQRLIIEPTGMAHPRELIRQLSEPHWQTALRMQAVIAVLSGSQWQQAKYRNHEGFQAHICAADVVVINRYEHLSATCQQDLQAWITILNPQTQIIWLAASKQSDNEADTRIITELTAQLDKPSQTIQQQTENSNQSRIRLQPPTSLSFAKSSDNTTDHHTTPASTTVAINHELPYRYHDQQQDIFQHSVSLGGWRLPEHWVFDADALQQWLLALPNWQRIKGVVHTSDGWLQLNFTPDSLTMTTTGAQIDSRLEIILLSEADKEANGEKTMQNDEPHQESQANWATWDDELMALIL